MQNNQIIQQRSRKYMKHWSRHRKMIVLHLNQENGWGWIKNIVSLYIFINFSLDTVAQHGIESA